MDLKYLLLLQSFREATNDLLTPFMEAVSTFVNSWTPFFIMAVFYWVFDKESGGWMVMTCAITRWINGILKLTACVYRPWIRDSRIVPAGDAITTATGYSFPSGHSTSAGSYYGCAAIYSHQKKKKALVVIFVLAILVTMFSRNYLGVHTPQDVIVGAGVTFLFAVLNLRLFRWMQEGDKKRDLAILIGGVVIVVASVLYITLKSYPMDYVDGELLVDPAKMRQDTIKAIGILAGALLGWLIEKNFIKFENPENKVRGVILGCISFIPAFLWLKFFSDLASPYLGKTAVKALLWGVPYFYVFTVGPLVMKKFGKEKK